MITEVTGLVQGTQFSAPLERKIEQGATRI